MSLLIKSLKEDLKGNSMLLKLETDANKPEALSEVCSL